MSFVAQRIGKKVFANKAKVLEPADPHYETFTDDRGRVKTRKRKMPSGLSKKDERILSVGELTSNLDKGFSLCGFRFGWTAIFGLIPFAGDIVAFLLSYFLVLRKCRQANLPLVLQQRMVFNQAVSVGSGMIPLVGDVILAVWKCNSRNAALLEEFLIARASKLTATHASEDAAAEQAIATARIHKASGERIGDRELLLPVELQEDRELAKGKRPWYGWGNGKKASAGARADNSLVGSSAAVDAPVASGSVGGASTPVKKI